MSPQQEMRSKTEEANVKKPICFFKHEREKKKKDIYNLTKKLSPNAQGTPCLSEQTKHTNVLCVFLWVVNAGSAGEWL